MVLSAAKRCMTVAVALIWSAGITIVHGATSIALTQNADAYNYYDVTSPNGTGMIFTASACAAGLVHYVHGLGTWCRRSDWGSLSTNGVRLLATFYTTTGGANSMPATLIAAASMPAFFVDSTVLAIRWSLWNYTQPGVWLQPSTQYAVMLGIDPSTTRPGAVKIGFAVATSANAGSVFTHDAALVMDDMCTSTFTKRADFTSRNYGGWTMDAVTCTARPSPTVTPVPSPQYCIPTPSSTASSTATTTASARASVSSSATGTASATSSSSGTPSPTATANGTGSTSPSPTASNSATTSSSAGATGTPSATSSGTASASSTGTVSPSASASGTASASHSAVSSSSATTSAAPSETATTSAQATQSVGVSSTATQSASASAEPSASGTATASPSTTASGTTSALPSATSSSSASRTAGPSSSSSGTASASASATATRTPSSLASSTRSALPAVAAPSASSSVPSDAQGPAAVQLILPLRVLADSTGSSGSYAGILGARINSTLCNTAVLLAAVLEPTTRIVLAMRSSLASSSGVPAVDVALAGVVHCYGSGTSWVGREHPVNVQAVVKQEAGAVVAQGQAAAAALRLPAPSLSALVGPRQLQTSSSGTSSDSAEAPDNAAELLQQAGITGDLPGVAFLMGFTVYEDEADDVLQGLRTNLGGAGGALSTAVGGGTGASGGSTSSSGGSTGAGLGGELRELLAAAMPGLNATGLAITANASSVVKTNSAQKPKGAAAAAAAASRTQPLQAAAMSGLLAAVILVCCCLGLIALYALRRRANRAAHTCEYCGTVIITASEGKLLQEAERATLVKQHVAMACRSAPSVNADGLDEGAEEFIEMRFVRAEKRVGGPRSSFAGTLGAQGEGEGEAEGEAGQGVSGSGRASSSPITGASATATGAVPTVRSNAPSRKPSMGASNPASARASMAVPAAAAGPGAGTGARAGTAVEPERDQRVGVDPMVQERFFSDANPMPKARKYARQSAAPVQTLG